VKLKHVVASWSGGIDSTAVLAQLAMRGYEITAVVLDIYRVQMPLFAAREYKARQNLIPPLTDLAESNGGSLKVMTGEADWIWAFSNDGIEIPRRNKHIIDHLIVRHMMPEGITNIAMGEYVGADTWLVRDHVGASDADHRSLSAYLYLEYGLRYRLISLQDFGESRYKSDRLRLGVQAIGSFMAFTTNCLANSRLHCGTCYKCVERAAAHEVSGIIDATDYESDPREHPRFALYLRQMNGEDVTSSFSVQC